MNKSRSEVVFGEFWRRGNDRPLWDGGGGAPLWQPREQPGRRGGGRGLETEEDDDRGEGATSPAKHPVRGGRLLFKLKSVISLQKYSRRGANVSR
ncbi:hypothetical protein GWI33_003599 [Rhynchophorus ferrugineus]|uniref:Uncharacterized protein n=1 Tax=Rhynchophorus ferrugineus TaxID=354439 RepID=A0A834HIU4_RHYFE|nr:hypothetical protein GWI33_003599 [Rhynchophorus ferrugineus]